MRMPSQLRKNSLTLARYLGGADLKRETVTTHELLSEIVVVVESDRLTSART
jgi:hypothetical protein